MINIITALKCEANPLINYYKLNKDFTINKFNVYRNDNINLIISKPGILNSAIAATLLIAKYSPVLSINIGVCASMDENILPGNLYLINKITNNNTNRSFYPDILLNHSLPENSLRTYDFVITDKKSIHQRENLIDMEAAGFAEASLKFLSPEKVMCLKIVSDYADNNDISPEHISNLVENKLDSINEIINKTLAYEPFSQNLISESENEQLSILSDRLYFTEYMKNSLKNLYIYYKLSGKPADSFFNLLKVNVNSKKEGKIYFEKIKSLIIK